MKKIFFFTLIAFVLTLNIFAALHAYRFTHFNESAVLRTKDPKQLSTLQKIKVLLGGVSLPKAENSSRPADTYQTIMLNKQTEAWYICSKAAKGTCLLFHGYGGCKSNLLNHAAYLKKLGYNCLLVDFAGAGGSKGNTVTIGYNEAETVKLAYDFVRRKQPAEKIVLLGSSMGAAAVLRCMALYPLQVQALILECPFATLYEAVDNRFKQMHIPSFPLASLLVFYGGLENGFWAFDHQPKLYAKHVHAPTLIFYGDADPYVKCSEIEDIYHNLQGTKEKVCLHGALHENYLNRYREEWQNSVKLFLDKK